MGLLQQIIDLSHRLASSLLQDNSLKELDDSTLFNEKDKKYISKQLTSKKRTKERILFLNQINITEDWQKVYNEIKEPLIPSFRWKKGLVAAAIITVIMSTTYFYNSGIFNSNDNLNLVVEQINPGQNKAILTLADGKEIVLDEENPYTDANVASNGEQLVYQNKNKKDKISYNQLTIPRGGQYFIKLSDDTKIWLNSESKIRYQVNFVDGEPRRVELVYGEAYFDVSPSKDHNGSEFIVYNKKQQVQVLGTEFNIKAYQDEDQILTTLVEGKVALKYENKKAYLLPNQQSTFTPTTNTFTIKQVDVYNEISWKNGIFSFEGKSLKEIMKVLSRWYDVEITFNDKSIENEEFVGVLGKDQNLENILNTIKSYGIIKKYEMKDKKIVLY